MRRIAGLVLAGALVSGLAVAQSSGDGKKNDCGKHKKKDANCSEQKDLPPAAAPPSSSMPGSDADVPGETPAASPQKPGETNRMPGNDADVPTGPDAPAPQKPGQLPDMPSDGKEPDPPGSGEPSHQKPSPSDAGGFSSSRDGTNADDAPAATTQDDDTPIKAAPLKNLGARPSSEAIHAKLDATRIQDDMKVAKFYENDGNWMGAYLRYKDVVERDATEEDAHWGWAQMAEKLNKPDEAREHYAEYLKLDPDGEYAREAHRALQKLGNAAKK